ncbi:MAG: nicotinate-nucleotide--dimethylbenzimidazole phosphoribosyltransferase [Magnetococcus sp. DMHC-6]
MKNVWYHNHIKIIANQSQKKVHRLLTESTLPPGGLGLIQNLAVRLTGMAGEQEPDLHPAKIVLFAADHGMVIHGVEAVSCHTSVAQIRSILAKEAPIAILADHLHVELQVIDVGLTENIEKLNGLLDRRIQNGSTDFLQAPAMTHEQLSLAMQLGEEAVRQAVENGVRLFIPGEIGVGGSTAAGAMVSILLGVAPELVAGPSKGLDEKGMVRKAQVIQKGIDRHLPFNNIPLEALRCLGGLDLAAMTGAFIACGQRGIPALVDGFVACTAALVAITLHPSLKEWLIFAHRSGEPGQRFILQTLDVQPILQLDLRLGEGFGALSCLPLLRISCELARKMLRNKQ